MTRFAKMPAGDGWDFLARKAAACAFIGSAEGPPFPGHPGLDGGFGDDGGDALREIVERHFSVRLAGGHKFNPSRFNPATILALRPPPVRVFRVFRC